ncbi:MAG: hypothetical protein ACE5KK_05265, partial [Candidatus Brocadiales bacterium]
MSRHVSLTGYLRNLFKCLFYHIGRLPMDVLLRDIYMGFKGVRLSELWQIYNEMPLIKGAQETMKGLKDRGCELAIISSGVPDFLVRDLAAKRLGADLGVGLKVVTSGD